MNWIVFAPVLAATLLLVLQGWSYLSVKDSGSPEHRYVGALSILLAILGVVLYALFATGALLVGMEFRLAMVHGTAAAFFLGLLVIGFSIATGLGWHVVRCTKKLPSRGLWILLAGAICGTITAARIRVLIPEEDVRYLDRWCPIMVIWLAVCVGESLITLIGVGDRWARIWWGMLMPVWLAWYVVDQAHNGFRFADPWTLRLWEAALLLGLPAMMASGAFLMADKWLARRQTVRRWPRLILVSAVLGGLLAPRLGSQNRGNSCCPSRLGFCR